MERNFDNDLRHRKTSKIKNDNWSGFSFTSDKRYSLFSLPLVVGYIIILLFLISLKLIVILENSLPQQLLIEEASSHPGRFIGERAELLLKRLTDLGTRVVGSYENEVLAIDFFKREISFISQEANRIHKIDLDIQNASGSYFMYNAFRNSYSNIQNVVVKLSSCDSKNSLLLNCHYDTVPESPGASDNGINCVIMLEILRVLSQSEEPLKNNIIFLFNGAEENPMQGSHGFLSHKWSKDVKVMINLDSAGAGGKDILFQTTGESWLLKAFAKSVPRPSAGVHAEELFQYGIIPSDTDFRIFKDFGKYSGFDIVHCTNGYIYHTKFDQMKFIKPGVYQNTGDNILALTRKLVDSPEFGEDHLKSKITYFDVFGLFVVFYEQNVGIILNLFTVFLSLFAVLRSIRMLSDTRKSKKKIAVAIGGQVLGLILGLAAVVFIGKTLDIFKSTMSWYSRPWIIVPLYVFPIMLVFFAILLLAQTLMKKDLPEFNVIRFINGAQLIWTATLFVGTVFKIRTTFFLMMFVLFPSLGSILVTFTRKFFSVKTYLTMYMCALIFPTLYILSQSVRSFTTLIPMTARMGSNVNGEMIIGGLAFIFSSIFLSVIIPVLLLLRKLKIFLISLSVIHLLAMAAVIFTKYGFPYNGNTEDPAFQRILVFHSQRTFYDANGLVEKSDSGFFVQGLDRNSVNYISKVIPELKETRLSDLDCLSEIFCGFPLFLERYLRSLSYIHYIPADPPKFFSPLFFEVVNRTYMGEDITRITVLITGPDHVTVGFSPKKNVDLVGWNFGEFRALQTELAYDRKTYMLYYSHGLGGRLMFNFDLKVPKGKKGPLVRIAVIGHYLHEKKVWSTEFNDFLSRFPDWVHLTPWINKYERWLI